MQWPTNILGGMDPARFLAEYWQKRPLLIRQAVPGFRDPLDPDELAGLACEDDIASRIVVELQGDRPWQVRHGPFDEAIFAEVPASHWSLLVQDMNRYVPALARLLDCFAFVPDWRIDDVMVSYAPEHGSVGPHIDNYDVFLLQGLGARRWQINCQPVNDDDLIAGLDLRILKRFEPEQEWVLEAGDMLYLPPGVQHYGVALEDCLTYSIGFRAPDRNELLSDLAHWLTEQADIAAPRYADPDLQRPQHPGEISADSLQQVRQLLAVNELTAQQLAYWFGGHATGNVPEDTCYFDNAPHDEQDFMAFWQQHGELLRNPLSRYAFSTAGNTLILCINGHCESHAIQLQAAIAMLCDQHAIRYEQVAPQLDDPQLRHCWYEWYRAGHLGLADDD
ncbi:MAG: cupin domain-containing protein [Granulosicoccaceae bacterium]|jgi:50S ribosomal protein L16 3-hydroxylase